MSLDPGDPSFGEGSDVAVIAGVIRQAVVTAEHRNTPMAFQQVLHAVHTPRQLVAPTLGTVTELIGSISTGGSAASCGRLCCSDVRRDVTMMTVGRPAPARGSTAARSCFPGPCPRRRDRHAPQPP